MSHFTTMVILNGHLDPTHENIAAALQPFHEFECTGTDDQYVQDIDILEEAKEKFAVATATLILQRPDGTLVDAFDDGEYAKEFLPFRDEDTRRLVLPDGWKEHRDLAAKDWEQFSDWCTDQYGIKFLLNAISKPGEDEKYGYGRLLGDKVTALIKRTNPNKRWDWWTVGGRWGGSLQAKDPSQASLGEIGLMGRRNDLGFDIVQVGNLDFETMKAENVSSRHASIDRNVEKLEIKMAEAFQIWAAHCAHWPELKKLKEKINPDQSWPDFYDALHADDPTRIAKDKNVLNALGGWGADIPDTEPDPRVWAEKAPTLGCWAFLQDGVWSERGEMGWWGMSKDEFTPEQWGEQVDKRVKGLDPSDWIVMIDCHI